MCNPLYTYKANDRQMRAMLHMSADGPQTLMRLKLTFADLRDLEDVRFVEKREDGSFALTELGERFVRIT